MELGITRIDKELPLPRYAHEGDAGLDLFSAADVVLRPFERALIPTGIAVAIPEGYAGFVQPRSGLAIKRGLGIANTPGLIDSHYRGEIKIILINLSKEDFLVEDGERIAQMIISRHEKAEWIQVEALNKTDRGAGGFGHSGTK